MSNGWRSSRGGALCRSVSQDRHRCDDLLRRGAGCLALAMLFLLCIGLGNIYAQVPASPDTTVRFFTVTASARVTFRHVNAASGRFYYLEEYGSGGAFFDYDNDGALDIYAVNGADLPGFASPTELTNRLYHNNGYGAFEDVTGRAGVGDTAYGMGCATGDYDNDGDLDLYVTNFGPNVLYRNNGDGTFTDVTGAAGVDDPRWSTSAAFVDYDADGWLDLYVGNYVDFTLETNKFCDVSGIQAYCHPRQYDGVPNSLYRSNGDGTFTDVAEAAGVLDPEGRTLGVVFGDYDDDGDLDLYVSNDANRNGLFASNGDGSFTDVTDYAGVGYGEFGKAESGMGTDFGDYDGDGLFDIFVCNYSFETNSLYRNEGDGRFSNDTFIAGLGSPSLIPLTFGTAFFDYDNDADQDIFVANGHVLDNAELLNDLLTHGYRNQLFKNDGHGNYTDATDEAGQGLSHEHVSRGAAFGDYDNDGDLDIFVVNCNQPATLLRNEGGDRRNWLSLKLVGTKSNRDGIGARIKLWAGDRMQVKEVKTGYSYCSANDVRVHFGLGDLPGADEIRIRWPSGLEETLWEVPANQFLTIREGEAGDRKQETGDRRQEAGDCD